MKKKSQDLNNQASLYGIPEFLIKINCQLKNICMYIYIYTKNYTSLLKYYEI